MIEEKQVYTSLKETQIKDFEKNWDAFIKNVKEHNGTPPDKTTK